MQVEKITTNKVQIFISYEDLAARGIDREEMWHNGKKVQDLFWDMMEAAYNEVGFEIVGPIAVEAFSMPTEGVYVIVTQVPGLPAQATSSDAEDDTDLSAVDPFGAFVFTFPEFEDVIRVARSLATMGNLFGSLYVYKDAYHLFFEEESISEEHYDAVWAVLHEYGELTTVTRAVLDEYGKLITERYALQVINHHFRT